MIVNHSHPTGTVIVTLSEEEVGELVHTMDYEHGSGSLAEVLYAQLMTIDTDLHPEEGISWNALHDVEHVPDRTPYMKDHDQVWAWTGEWTVAR